MANVAQDAIDVILGEAVSGSPTERFKDMLAIASVIANRARATGESARSIVSAKSQFGAYGKRLPKGANSFRNLAERAWQHVQKKGPVHSALYYATPQAVKNLPSGLQPVTRTAGHVYFEDPSGRHIRTASGYRAPSSIPAPSMQVASLGNIPVPAPRPTPPLAMNVPVPAERPDRGRGMAALVPSGHIEFRNPGQERIAPGLRGALLGSSAELGRDIGINSGYRSPSYNRSIGGARNSYHTRGEAVDIDMSGMSIPARQQLVQELTQRGAGGFITYTRSPDMMHVDMRPRPNGTTPHFMHDKTSKLMGNASGWFKEMAAAGGIRNPHTAPVPTPAPRDGLLASQEGSGLLASPAAAEEPVQVATADAVSGSTLSEQKAPQASSFRPVVDPQTSWGAMAATNMAAKPSQNVSLPQTAPFPTPRPETAPPLPDPRIVHDYPVTPLQEAINLPSTGPVLPDRFASPEPSLPSGMHAISGLFAAPQGATATSISNPEISFRSLGNGMIEKTNQYGATSLLSPEDYSHPATPGPQVDYPGAVDYFPDAPKPQQGLLSGIFGPVGKQGVNDPENPARHYDDFMGIPEARTRGGRFIRGGLGAAAGGVVLGSLLGPVGAAIGGAIGREIAQGRDPRVAFRTQDYTEPNWSLNTFPAAPKAPSGSFHSGGNNGPSYDEMRSLSPRAASAIAGGKAGLY